MTGLNSAISALSPLLADIETDHGTLSAFVRRGQRADVILLHGNSSSKEVFAYVIPSLIEAGYGVIAPDFPGHGDSADAVDPVVTYSFPGYAASIAALLQVLGVTRPIVVGWSLGGHVAMQTVHDRPDAAGLMIIGSPPGKPSMETFKAAFYADGDATLAGKRDFNSDEVNAYASAMLGMTDVDPFLRLRVRRTDGRARQYMFHSAISGIGIDQTLIAKDRTRPLAVVHGERDPFVRLAYLRELTFGRLWQDEVIVIAGAGHAPHWEKPDQFNRILMAFLASIDAN